MDNNVALHDLRKWKYALFILFSLPGLSFSTWTQEHQISVIHLKRLRR